MDNMIVEVEMNPLTRYEPLVGRLDGLFNEFFRPAFVWDHQRPAEALPIRVDVRETPEAYTVTAELPGLRKDEIAVEVEGNEVTLSAETRREELREGGKWLRQERFVGKAARRFALPQELDGEKTVAKFADGVLELTLPKKAAATGRKIEIN